VTHVKLLGQSASMKMHLGESPRLLERASRMPLIEPSGKVVWYQRRTLPAWLCGCGNRPCRLCRSFSMRLPPCRGGAIPSPLQESTYAGIMRRSCFCRCLVGPLIDQRRYPWPCKGPRISSHKTR